MNQRFLSTFSIVVIKHIDKEDTFVLGNQSFIRSEIFLSKNISAKQFDNSLFYVQVDGIFLSYKGNNRQFNQPIEFQQKIMFRHKISNKYLSFSEEFEQEQNDTTYRLQLSEKKCFFKIYPCFQYQTKISSKIKFNEDIYITSDINTAKLGYISTREIQNPTQDNSLLSNRKRTVLGMNYKSKFILHNYYELQKEETNYTFGSIIWLTHIQCANFLAVAQQQPSSQQLKQEPQQQTRYEVMFENLQVDKDMQSIQGLWLIESDNYETGGKLHFEHKFMLKNLYSGSYLSFSKNYKLLNNERIYNFTLEENPSEQSKFVFRSLKGEDSRIKKGSYLILKNNGTQAFIGCRRKKIKDASKLSKPTIYFDFSDQDLFKIIQLSQDESQAIRFIFGVREELKYICKVLLIQLNKPKIIQKSSQNNPSHKVSQKLTIEQQKFLEIYSLYDNMKRQLIRLSNFDKLYEQVQLQLIRYIERFTDNIKELRKWDMALRQDSNNEQFYNNGSVQSLIRNTLKTIYDLLRMICHENRSNQLVFYRYIHHFIDDFFFNVGAEDLMITIFSNNYSLLCKVPDSLPQMANQNIVKTIIRSITRPSVVKNQQYWLNIEKIMKLFMTFIYLNKSTIDINQRLISEELFEEKMFDKVFFGIKITGQRIKVEIGSFNNAVGNKKFAASDYSKTNKESLTSRSNKSSLIEIQQIRDPLINKIIQGLFELLWSLCANRNFISKKAIDRYLNESNKDGPSILIGYLTIPISKKLLNSLYGLITNLYVDSCPRIDRYRPLSVVNFVFGHGEEVSRSQQEENEISSRLNEHLLRKMQESYRSRPLFMSNLLTLSQNSQPTLNSDQLDSYKDEISNKLLGDEWSVQLLNSMRILLSLEIYTVPQIIQIFSLMSNKLSSRSPIPTDLTISIMDIYEQVSIYNLELEMKKMTTYLKYKFIKKEMDLFLWDAPYLLPGSNRIASIFDGKATGQQENGKEQIMIGNQGKSFSPLSGVAEQYNSMREKLQKLSPDISLKKQLYNLFTSCVSPTQHRRQQLLSPRPQLKADSVSPLSKLFSENPVLKALGTSQLLNSSKNPEYLKSIHKTFVKFNRPKYYFLRLLMDSIVVTSDEVQTFQFLFEKFKTLKHLISISEYWLCNDQQGQEDTQKFFASIEYVIAYFYDGYTFQGKVNFRKDYNNINVNRQLLIRNLGFHMIVLELLETNFYLLEKKRKKEISKKHLTTFEKCFELLIHFVHECRENKELIHANWHILNKFRDLVEVGQTALYIELLKDHKAYTRQIKPILVEKLITKITRPIDPKTFNPDEMISSTINDECQFNPEFLRLIRTICIVQGKCYKPNLEMVYKFLEKEHVFKRIFFAEEDKNRAKFKFCLDLYKIRSDPVQVPFIYHAQVLKLMNLLISEMESLSSSLKIRLEAMFPIEYLFELMGENDIFSNTGTQAELNFLLKRQVTKLCTCFLDKNDKFSKLSQSPVLTNLLLFIKRTFVEYHQRSPVQIQNQKFYQFYLEKYRHEISYYQSNQRVYYTDFLKPFLIKLKFIFEKTNSFSTIKNYHLIIMSLQSIKIQKLSHDLDAQKERYNIDSVNIKWRNFVDKDLENSKEEKFAKRSLLELLRNPQTVKILQNQKAQFFKLIKSLSPSRYIETINVLLQLLMQEEPTQNQSEQNIIQIYEILSILEQFFSSLTPQQVDNMTPTFEQCHFIEHLIDYCNLSTFDYNNIMYKKILDRILKIFNVIMQNDEEVRIHKTFFKYFNQNLMSYRFFRLLNHTISEIGERVQGQRFFDQVNNALNSLYLCVEDRKMSLDREGLRFVSQLCNYNPFTSFLRFQTMYPSIDFLQKIYGALTYILYQQGDHVKINVIVVDTAQEILRCISSFLTGGNKMNQSYIIDNKFPQILNEVLRMEALKQTYNQGQINERNRLLEEVIEFYDSNGIEIGKLLNNRIKVIDFRDIYVLNRMKEALLRTLTECVTGNQRAFSKIKIQIPIEFLKINLIWIYEDFINSNQEFKESLIIRKKENWDLVVEQQKPNSLFLMIGFYFYMLIQNYNLLQKEKIEEEDDMADDKEKNKQKVVKKFFSSISDKEKREDQMKSLQKQPFAEEMKQFYQKYYEALEFFGKYSLTIEVNLLGSLARVYFPKLPICEKLTEPMIEKFKLQADRVSQDEKIKSLLQFSEKIYEELQGEQEFFEHFEKNYPYLTIFLKSMKYESEFLFIAWILAVIQTFFFLAQDYVSPSWDFSMLMFVIPQSLNTTLIFIISMFNLYLAAMLLIYIFARKIPVIVKLKRKKFMEQAIEEGIWSNEWVYVGVQTLSEISYIVFVIFCLIATFVHPMFAGFLLTEILNRIEIGKQIIRSIRETWVQLLVAVALLIIINLLYSMLIYVAFYQPYSPTCENFLQCMLFLIDSSLKSGQGFLGISGVQLYPDVVTDQSNPNIRFFCQVLYVVFAQMVVFQIFSGTIIDKFSQLRQQSVSIVQDEQSMCYICGLERFNIDFEYEGFETHTQMNHNKVNYIFYLFYLKKMYRDNYGIVEKYIEECQLKKKKDWIPDGTSIFKEEKEKAEQKEQQNEDDQKIHQKFYIKKSQQLKKVKQSTGIFVQDLRSDIQQ